jgi:hypothetical protein
VLVCNSRNDFGNSVSYEFKKKPQMLIYSHYDRRHTPCNSSEVLFHAAHFSAPVETQYSPIRWKFPKGKDLLVHAFVRPWKGFSTESLGWG